MREQQILLAVSVIVAALHLNAQDHATARMSRTPVMPRVKYRRMRQNAQHFT